MIYIAIDFLKSINGERLFAEYYLSIISKILGFRSNNGENKWTCENNRKCIDT